MCTFLCVQVEYRKYCSRKYGRVIDYPILPDVASETSAQERCKKLWTILYPKEPFDILANLCKLPGGFGKSNQVLPLKDADGSELVRDLVPVIDRQSSFYYQVHLKPSHNPSYKPRLPKFT